MEKEKNYPISMVLLRKAHFFINTLFKDPHVSMENLQLKSTVEKIRIINAYYYVIGIDLKDPELLNKINMAIELWNQDNEHDPIFPGDPYLPTRGLYNALDIAVGLNEASYTVTSWTAFQEAYDRAYGLPEDTDNEKIAKTEAIQDSIGLLVELKKTID